MKDKTQQRQTLRRRTAQFTDKHTASQTIAKKLFELEEYELADSVFVYLSTDKEVDTYPIVERAFKDGKRVFVPVTQEEMRLAEIFPITPLIKAKYGIKEPKNTGISQYTPDIAIIPLVGFDTERNRLGQGKGYYDRFLRNFTGKKIALAFSVQKLEGIITDSNDIKMDMIITEEETL
ncbi:MAG: 5-formyltetrahydrofolate cyclo-ligase [Clostridia bacterium]|nr:5-formyltetrahydrofolate cyclo-ligase [Clostridia bacterium]